MNEFDSLINNYCSRVRSKGYIVIARAALATLARDGDRMRLYKTLTDMYFIRISGIVVSDFNTVSS